MKGTVVKAAMSSHLPMSVIPGEKVVRSQDVVYVGGRPGAKEHEAAVDLITENGVVKAIDVTCSCGQTIRLVCSYESNSPVR